MIEAEISRDYAGYNGEKLLDYHLKVFTGPDIRIYNDLRFDDGNPFQIDTIITSPSLILPIDAKNFDGETNIESTFNQSIQIDSNGNTKRLSNPIAQAKRHNFLLSEWFKKHQYYSLPIKSLIANCNPVGLLSADSNIPLLNELIVNVEMIPQKIEELLKEFPRRLLSTKDLDQIHRYFMEEHTPFLLDIEKVYGLKKKNVMKGVCCEKCGFCGMERKNRHWACPKCGEKSLTAHKQALREYFLLIKQSITVAECCDFLGIDSRFVARRLLQSMNLIETGSDRNHQYHWRWNLK